MGSGRPAIRGSSVRPSPLVVACAIVTCSPLADIWTNSTGTPAAGRPPWVSRTWVKAAAHLETIGGRNPLIEAQRGDAEDFAERRVGLGANIVLHTARKLLQDEFLPCRPRRR